MICDTGLPHIFKSKGNETQEAGARNKEPVNAQDFVETVFGASVHEHLTCWRKEKVNSKLDVPRLEGKLKPPRPRGLEFSEDCA